MDTLAPDHVAELRVASRTAVTELAQAISHALYDNKKVVLRAVGAGAVNQAVKGIIQAQQYTAARGLVLATRPGFHTITMDGEERSAIVLHVFVMP